MTLARWEIRKRLPGQTSPASWWVIAPDEEGGRAFPWPGCPRKEPALAGRWAFPFGRQSGATSALSEFLDRERERRSSRGSGA